MTRIKQDKKRDRGRGEKEIERERDSHYTEPINRHRQVINLSIRFQYNGVMPESGFFYSLQADLTRRE